MLNNLPPELLALNQWVISGHDKEPVNPRNGFPARVTDPSTWASFEEAKSCNYPHVGFVLADDPYTIIDLDDPFQRKDKTLICEGEPDYEEAVQRSLRHRKIFEAFDSYAELSQSGRGVHIIVRGRVPSGVRRDKVEIYSDARYMICTGNALPGRNKPITDCQAMLDVLHGEMASTIVDENYQSELQIMSDDALLEMASNAVNGAKFNDLCAGRIQDYPSQSEADFALCTILAFYSKNDEQVMRVFRMTALGQREKAQRDEYFLGRYGMLSKIRPRQAVPKVDISALLEAPPKPPIVSVEPEPVSHLVELPKSPLVFPPGLVGAVADYIYSSATRPVAEVALVGALAMLGGVGGRSYNISSTGLNQYLILLADTGIGKEGAANGIDALFAAIRPQLPAVDQYLGPAVFASGQALVRLLDSRPCFVSILGEFGLTLQSLCDKNAAPHSLMLRKMLLALYSKSGHTNILQPSVYSDTERNTNSVRAPNVTILGESTPSTFYDALDSSHIAEGLVPRFTLFEYTGGRPPRNQNAYHRPNQNLVLTLKQLVEISLQTAQNTTVCPIAADSSAQRMMDEYDVAVDERINATRGSFVAEVWNRAHLKVLKLAGLLAMGCNLHQPVITKELAEWAITTVDNDSNGIAKKFSSGEVGKGDHQLEHALRIACEKYATLSPTQRRQYKVPVILSDKNNLIPHAFLKCYLIQRAAFKNDRRGAMFALDVTIKDCIKAGMLAQIPVDQARRELSTDSPVYYRGESW